MFAAPSQMCWYGHVFETGFAVSETGEREPVGVAPMAMPRNNGRRINATSRFGFKSDDGTKNSLCAVVASAWVRVCYFEKHFRHAYKLSW